MDHAGDERASSSTLEEPIVVFAAKDPTSANGSPLGLSAPEIATNQPQNLLEPATLVVRKNTSKKNKSKTNAAEEILSDTSSSSFVYLPEDETRPHSGSSIDSPQEGDPPRKRGSASRKKRPSSMIETQSNSNETEEAPDKEVPRRVKSISEASSTPPMVIEISKSDIKRSKSKNDGDSSIKRKPSARKTSNLSSPTVSTPESYDTASQPAQQLAVVLESLSGQRRGSISTDELVAPDKLIRINANESVEVDEEELVAIEADQAVVLPEAELADLDQKPKDELLAIIALLHDQHKLQSNQLNELRVDRDRFADIIERTNMSLLDLKQNIDRTMQKNEEKIQEYKQKVKTLSDRLTKEKEKTAAAQRKLKKIEASTTMTGKRGQAVGTSSRTGANQKTKTDTPSTTEPSGLGLGLIEPASEIELLGAAKGRTASLVGQSGVPTKIRWSDKVRRDRSVLLKLSEGRDFPKQAFSQKADSIDGFFFSMQADGKEIIKTMTLSSKFFWNESFQMDVHSLHESLDLVLVSRKGKTKNDSNIGSVKIRRDQLAIDNLKHEEWFTMREIKEAAPEVKIDLEWVKGPSDSMVQLCVKLLSARHLRRPGTRTELSRDITVGVTSSTASLVSSSPSPYAIVHLVPSETLETARQSKVVINNSDPVYNEPFYFSLSSDQAKRSYLHVTFWSFENHGDHDFLGQCILPLKDFEQSCRRSPYLPYIPLNFRAGTEKPGSGVYKGGSVMQMNVNVLFGQLSRLQERVLCSACRLEDFASHSHTLQSAKLTTCLACDHCGGLMGQTTDVLKCSCGLWIHVQCAPVLQGECFAPIGSVRFSYRYVEEIILPYGAYNNMLELLTDDNLLVLTSLGHVCDQLEEVATTLLNIFESQGTAIRYMTQLITQEIKSTRDPNTIFRGNSLASKSVDSFMKVVGREYLQSVLKDVIDEIFVERKNCEIDPIKLESLGIDRKSIDETQKKNMKNLVSYVRKIVDVIFESVDRCPRPMREIFSFLQEEVTKYFPDDSQIRYSAVSGFIFLRFFVPCILGPKLFGLRDDLPDPIVLRTLTLAAKTLQNLANGVDFGFKEPFMTDLNQFIASEKEALRLFIDTLSNNLITARERVSELEQSIDDEQKIMDGVANMHKMLKNADIAGRKNRAQVNQNLLQSQDKIKLMTKELERLKRMCKNSDEKNYGVETNVDYGRLFNVDVEKELAAIHRHLSRRKDAVLKALEGNGDDISLNTAIDLVGVLDQLEEIRTRLLAEESRGSSGNVILTVS